MTDEAKNNSLQRTIIDELGLSDLPQDKKDQLLLRMTEAVLQRIFLETMEKLSEKDQAEYEKLIDENAAPEDLEKFLQGKIAGYDEMVKMVVEKFKQEMQSDSPKGAN